MRLELNEEGERMGSIPVPTIGSELCTPLYYLVGKGRAPCRPPPLNKKNTSQNMPSSPKQALLMYPCVNQAEVLRVSELCATGVDQATPKR